MFCTLIRRRASGRKCRSRFGATQISPNGAPVLARCVFLTRHGLGPRASGRCVALATDPRKCRLEVAFPRRRLTCFSRVA
eukprot:319777-Pyramimonas_sp.AAC.1